MDTHKNGLILLSGNDEELARAVPSGSMASVLNGNPVIEELKQLCEQAESMKVNFIKNTKF